MINLEYIWQILPDIANALLITLVISLIGILLATIGGFIIAISIYFRLKFLTPLAQLYVKFFRNTPLILHLFFLYYGLPRLLGIVLEFTTVAIIGLSLVGAAYMAEGWRSGLSAIRNNQLESAIALALNRWQLLRYIILPQAFSYCFAALGANCIFLFKETSVFTAIAGTDVTTVAIALVNMDYKTKEVLLLLVLAYLMVLLPFILLLGKLEKKVRHAEFG